MLDLAGHLGGHLGLLGVDAVRVGNLVSLLAVNLGHLEVNLSGHQFALSPSDGFASLISGPNLGKNLDSKLFLDSSAVVNLKTQLSVNKVREGSFKEKFVINERRKPRKALKH